MIKVGELLKVLNALNPSLSEARLALSNYLLMHCEANQIVTHELFQDFIGQALEYAHWQKKRSELTDEISHLLAKLRDHNLWHLPTNQLRLPSEVQIVDVQEFADWTQCLERYLNFRYPGETSRLIYDDPSKHFFGLVLHNDQSLTLFQFHRRFRLDKGVLTPLSFGKLEYDAELQLQMNQPQHFEISNFNFCRLIRGENGFSAVVTRGYLFEKMSEIKVPRARDLQRIFFVLKRFEHLFLARKSNGFYQGLLQNLEITIQDVRMRLPDSVKKATSLLSEAENALEWVFIGDRFLSLLVRDLRTHLQKEGFTQEAISWPKMTQKSDSINYSPTEA